MLAAETAAARHRSGLAAVLSSCLGVGLIFGFQPPLIAVVLNRAGASGFAIGAVTAASLIAVILLGPFYPRVIVRLGIRACVTLGIGCAAFILCLMPLWPNVGFWFCLRFLAGCALGLCWISSEVWLNGISGDATRGTIMGLYGMIFSAGTMIGPALLAGLGTRGWQPFAFGAACLGLTLLPFLAGRGAQPPPQAFSLLRGLATAAAHAPVVMAAALVAGLIESAELTLLPLFSIHAGFTDRIALWLVTLFMAGNVVLQVPIGLMADRYGRRAILSACALANTVGPVLLLPWLHTPALLWPLLFLWGGTLYALYSQGIALLGEAFAPADLPAANTVFVMVYCVGGVIGPSVGGLLMDARPDLGLQALVSVAALLLLGALVFGPRHTRLMD